MSHESLERFVRAQKRDYSTALAELSAGRKRTHWIWYVLPQLRGLGHSQEAQDFGIANAEEAAAYFAHPVLGPRLVECVHTMMRHSPRVGATEILGSLDAVKFRSCLTLFSQVVPDEPSFVRALTAFYGGQPDYQTLRLLGRVAE
jgi:uncharacterized protein (DUF1810 family)